MIFECVVCGCVVVWFFGVLCLQMYGIGVFFFKQKTAYEMRISDWSSDVCSSDLRDHAITPPALSHRQPTHPALGCVGIQPMAGCKWRTSALPEIGRASCRERVCQYV